MDNLHIDSLMKSYGNNQILTDIFLSVKKGEIIGLLGRNGSGKSTLLKIIFGSIIPDRKFVKIGDKKIKNLCESYNKISYLPQEHYLPNHVKIKTIVDLMCNNIHKDFILNHELIKPHIDKKSKQLSVGEKRFLEILLCT
ncbi:MAG: ATP-binding cassette domain-containing protein, partial [Bacteroidales bacterium]|nr:ATP-binding cassette domain-containing protein [Bacteroidales bacterium]